LVELLGYLAANGFTNYIASGGGRDFMRPITQEVYGIPRDRVIGNSNGDIPMLDFTQHPGKPSLRLLVLHDDGQREFAYTSGAEQALERVGKSGWTIVSIKNDWATVF